MDFLTSSPELAQNGCTERIRNFHPKVPKPQNHVSEPIVGKVGGSQQGGFGGCSPVPKTGTRVLSDVPRYKKTGTRVWAHSPKPPFDETVLCCLSKKNKVGTVAFKYELWPCVREWGVYASGCRKKGLSLTGGSLHDGSTSAQKPTQLGPIQKRSQSEFFEFFSPSPHEAAVLLSAIVAKTCVFFHLYELLSPKVFDLDGCFSSENPCHDQGDSLVWTGSQ